MGHNNQGIISCSPTSPECAAVHRKQCHRQPIGVCVPVNRVLVLGGGDVGSAVAHRLFRLGVQVLVSERERSPHARRGMAFTDALFEGHASLDGVEARWQPDLPGVRECWQRGDAVPVVTLPEDLLVSGLQFDALVEATMRRYKVPPDLRPLAPCVVGLGPGYVPGENCHLAIETQWGAAMGQVLHDSPAATRSGGPVALAGVTRERFAIAPAAGTWRTARNLGQHVEAGEELGWVGDHLVRVPVTGHLRGLARDGVQVPAGQRVAEVDPRESPQIFGLGERPLAIAEGVVIALGLAPAAVQVT
jgi:xanthine dehydrogenase accessory factor